MVIDDDWKVPKPRRHLCTGRGSDRRHLRLPETRPPIVDTHSLWIHNWGSVRRACRRVVRVGFVVLAAHRDVRGDVRGGPASIADSFWERLRSAEAETWSGPRTGQALLAQFKQNSASSLHRWASASPYRLPCCYLRSSSFLFSATLMKRILQSQ